MLGNSTIIYIFDTQHFIIICILLYLNILPFLKHYLHYNIYAILLIGPPVVYSLLFIIHLLFLQPIYRDYSWLSFD